MINRAGWYRVVFEGKLVLCKVSQFVQQSLLFTILSYAMNMLATLRVSLNMTLCVNRRYILRLMELIRQVALNHCHLNKTHFSVKSITYTPTNQELWSNRRHHSDYLVALRWRMFGLVQSQFYLTWPRNHYGKLDQLPASFIIYRCHCDDEIQVLAQFLFN